MPVVKAMLDAGVSSSRQAFSLLPLVLPLMRQEALLHALPQFLLRCHAQQSNRETYSRLQWVGAPEAAVGKIVLPPAGCNATW